jgi:5-methylcytosine-specific restriction endonuclease McrA
MNPFKPIPAETKRKVFEKHGGKCARCSSLVKLSQCRVDHISQARNSEYNRFKNLRILCQRCYVLRIGNNADIAGALAKGIIPSDWRPLAWD